MEHLKCAILRIVRMLNLFPKVFRLKINLKMKIHR